MKLSEPHGETPIQTRDKNLTRRKALQKLHQEEYLQSLVETKEKLAAISFN
jgi:hypothetical protein